MIGNKGAATISFQFLETSFCFICCHLAARAERYEKRARDVFRIVKMLSVGRSDLDVLHQFHHVIFFGDMNYRVEREFDKVCEWIKKEKWTDIVEYDQLAFQMQKKQVFYGFKEGAINFTPTYRWERNKNSINNKRDQAPSYCDRILYTSLDGTFDLKQLNYQSAADAFGSDHRPIYSVFTFVPNLPYFTNPEHFQIMGEQFAPASNKLAVQNARIDLVALKANFIGVSELSVQDELHATFHHYYIEKPVLYCMTKLNIKFFFYQRIVGGIFESHYNAFSWPGIELETQCILQPYISDPEYLSHTHVFVEFINASKSNQIIGYATISLLHAFPVKLLARVDEIKEKCSEKRDSHSDKMPHHQKKASLLGILHGKEDAVNESQKDEKSLHNNSQEEKRKEKIIQQRIEEQQLIDSNKHKGNINTSDRQIHHKQLKPLDMSRVKRDANAPKSFEVPILLYGRFVGEVNFYYFFVD
ncbi:hypothetical protein RFI_17956 [Reticulomyxa filosa]|uniref:Inositol polyphosphate-related phosphatase domain-containing protein n=1 Tax=Reticulomyxa filosa TaxID=46433 RepID=X6MZ04_RETFI|nr:hypothetical protein RFI_17956 [Reticulomyxa filosa]|eukprot:ETO19275.1 hypothetical protein RFI_17956 [Reticulomyxa filosa]